MADPVNEGQSACVSHQLFKTSRVGEKKYVLVCLYTMTRPKMVDFRDLVGVATAPVSKKLTVK